METCDQCGEALQPPSRFCARCGTPRSRIERQWRWWGLVMLSICAMGVWLVASGPEITPRTQTPEAKATPSTPETEATPHEKLPDDCIETASYAGFIAHERDMRIDRRALIKWTYAKTRSLPTKAGFETWDDVTKTVNLIYRNELQHYPCPRRCHLFRLLPLLPPLPRRNGGGKSRRLRRRLRVEHRPPTQKSCTRGSAPAARAASRPRRSRTWSAGFFIYTRPTAIIIFRRAGASG